MLEEIRSEDDVVWAAGERAVARDVEIDRLDPGSGELREVDVGVERDAAGSDHVVDELAVAGAEIEHGVAGLDVALKELAAQDPPDLGLAPPILGAEARLVEARDDILRGHRPTSYQWTLREASPMLALGVIGATRRRKDLLPSVSRVSVRTTFWVPRRD